MVTWGEFERADAEVAAKGRSLFYRTGHGEAVLATVRGNQSPRIHPVAVAIVNGGLFAFVLPSPKLFDLEKDGRFAMHAYPDAEVPHEFMLRGRARRVDVATREQLAADWSFDVGNASAYEFLIEEAIVGERDDRNTWPPRYAVWPKTKRPPATR